MAEQSGDRGRGGQRGNGARGGSGGSRGNGPRGAGARGDRSGGPRGGDKSRGDQSRGDQSRGDQSRGDQSRGGGSRGDAGRGTPRAGAPGRSGARPGSGSGRSSGGKGAERGPRRDEWKRSEQVERTVDQAEYDGPELDASITGRELDRNLANHLKGVPDKLALRIARHLVAAQQLIDSDPETAYRHTLAARARATRLAMVREAVGEAAYAAGHYKEALAELRAAKRMNGATAYLPIMADCQRALGQPEKALDLARNPSVAGFSAEAKAEMTIVEAGARLDLGQHDAALRTLEQAPLNNKSREAWVVRLRYVYAEALLAAGRTTEALEWFHRTHAIDAEEITDAQVRAAELENPSA